MSNEEFNDRDDELIQAAARMPKAIAPERDLWPEIDAAISQPQVDSPGRSWWTPMIAQAAAVVLLVGASSGLTYVLTTKDQAVTVVASPDLVFDRVAFGDGYNLGPGFQDARGSVAASLDDELEKLDEADRAEVEENLELIRTAIAEINAALEKDPDNALLQELLLKTYREELNVMRQVGGLTQDVMSRNDI